MELPELVQREVDAYLTTASVRESWPQPTRCEPWSVHDVTRHLAATFERFDTMLIQARQGNLSEPFTPSELAGENLTAVASFVGDPLEKFERAATHFLAAIDDLSEETAHQRGPISVHLQLLFALNDVTIHHDDIAAATGGSYRPDDAVIALLVDLWEQHLGGLADGDDDWQRILTASGR